MDTGPVWLGSPFWAMLSVQIVNVWRGVPFFGITLLAGLQTIPEELYEAAEVDGARAWHKFWHITVPLLMPVTAVVTLFSIIQTFADFEIVFVLTRGGPGNSTHLFATLTQQIAIQNGRLGQGAAISLFTAKTSFSRRSLVALSVKSLIPASTFVIFPPPCQPSHPLAT